MVVGKRHIARVVAVLLLCSALPASATTFVATSERALARAADAVVVGTVDDIESVAGPDGSISTLVTLSVEGQYKGAVGRTLVLKQPGGQLADRGFWVAGSPQFHRGQRNLLFLSAARDGTARTTAYGMGQFVLENGIGGDVMAQRALTERVVGGGAVRRLKLSRLIRTIRRAIIGSETTVRPLRDPDELTQPNAERMTLAGFTFMDSPNGRWKQPDNDLPVVYDVDASGDNTLGLDATLAAVDGAMAAWTNVSGATIVLQRGDPAPPAPLLCDGLSQIVFNDPYGEMPNPDNCSGVLALGGYCTVGRSGELEEINGIRVRRISEGNITFANGFGGCTFWRIENLAEIVTHELGHTIGIGHSSEDDRESSPALKDATMYYRAHFDGRGAALRADDIAAVRALYPGIGGEPSTDDMDGDGVADGNDNCPGDDPSYGLANAAQTDADADGMGDLCDPCPLVPGTGDGAACQQISLTKLETRTTARGNRLSWRGAIDLLSGGRADTARVLLVAGSSTILDTAMATRTTRNGRLPASLTYRTSGATISLKRGRFGIYRVRVKVRDIDLGGESMPVLSANLQVGDRTFTASMSCPPRGAAVRWKCRG
jgi:hypothetical protein